TMHRIQTRLAELKVGGPDSQDQHLFLRSALLSVQGVSKWVKSHGDAAKAGAASSEAGSAEEARLTRIAEACAWVATEVPRTFFEAMQLFWLVYLAGRMEGANLGYSPGRFCDYMLPFLSDEDKDEDVLLLLRALRVKMTELEYVASFSWSGLGSGNNYQNLIISGPDSRLARLTVQAAIDTPTIQPTLSIWYEKDAYSKEFLDLAVDCVKTGIGFPAWFNLPTYIQHELEASKRHGLEKVITEEVIRKRAAMGGCTEPTLGGMSYGVVQAGFINHLKLFELALYGDIDPRTGRVFTEGVALPQTVEDVKARYLAVLEKTVHCWTQYWNLVMAAHRQTVPLVFTSAMIQDCIGRGKSIDDGGVVIGHSPTTLSTGMVNVANSFAALESLSAGGASMEEIRAALKANFVDGEDGATDYERLRRVGAAAPKWGNDDDRVDTWFTDLFDKYCKVVRKQTNFLGKQYDPSMLAISTHEPFGRACIASPDGRLAGETLCDGVTSPSRGTDTQGPLAVLHSAGKVDHTQIRGGLHNMRFHPSAIAGVRGTNAMLSLIEGYFASGKGFQLQFNVIPTEILLDAQKHPEMHRDLLIRVSGFSAYFVELSRGVQDEVIARTTHGNLGQVTPTGESVAPKEVTSAKGLKPRFPGASLSPSAGEAVVFNVQDFCLDDGQGLRSNVFFKGCPLRCGWCGNIEGVRLNHADVMVDTDKCSGCHGSCDSVTACTHGDITMEDGTPSVHCKDIECLTKAAAQCHKGNLRLCGQITTLPALLAKLLKNKPFYGTRGGVTLSGGEPLAQPSAVCIVTDELVSAGVTVCIETCGQWEWTKEIEECLGKMTTIFFDCKAIDSALHKQATGRGNETILANLKRCAELFPQTLVVSVPVIPGLTLGEAPALSSTLTGYGVQRMRLLPFHSLGDSKWEQLGGAGPYAGCHLGAQEYEGVEAAMALGGVKVCTHDDLC
ncbi:glycyl radical enzyme activase, partial [Kipferlia bialata]